MLFLIAHVFDHPFQILCSKAHHTISGLPVEKFTISQFMVDVMRTRALQLSNPIGDQKCRRNAHYHMNMSLCSADFMKDYALRLQGVTANVSMQARLNLGADDRQARLHVPSNMEIDFGIDVSRHELLEARRNGLA